MQGIVVFIAGFIFTVIGSSMWGGELPFVPGVLVGVGIALTYNAGILRESNRQ